MDQARMENGGASVYIRTGEQLAAKEAEEEAERLLSEAAELGEDVVKPEEVVPNPAIVSLFRPHFSVRVGSFALPTLTAVTHEAHRRALAGVGAVRWASTVRIFGHCDIH